LRLESKGRYGSWKLRVWVAGKTELTVLHMYTEIHIYCLILTVNWELATYII